MRGERSRLLTPLMEIAKYKTGGGESRIKPNTPFVASLTESSNSGNYYTLFDVSGSGVWNYISLWNNGIDNRYLDIRITVDGESAYELDKPNLEIYALGMNMTLPTSTSYNATRSRVFYPNLEFKTALKVEVKGISTTSPIHAFATYGMVI
jgi:hypothetical protein